jgi:hypothetical protein
MCSIAVEIIPMISKLCTTYLKETNGCQNYQQHWGNKQFHEDYLLPKLFNALAHMAALWSAALSLKPN